MARKIHQVERLKKIKSALVATGIFAAFIVMDTGTFDAAFAEQGSLRRDLHAGESVCSTIVLIGEDRGDTKDDEGIRHWGALNAEQCEQADSNESAQVLTDVSVTNQSSGGRSKSVHAPSADSNERGILQREVAMHEERVQMARETYGNRARQTADALNSLGNTQLKSGEYKQAERTLREAIEIDYGTIGRNHPDHASTLNNLAESFHYRGRYEEAEAIYLEVLDLTIGSPEVPKIKYAIRLHNYAELLRATDRLGLALILRRSAAEEIERVFGPDHREAKLYWARYNQLLSEWSGLARHSVGE